MVDYYGFYYKQKLVFANAAFERLTNFPVLFIIDDTTGRYPELTAYDEIDFKDKNGNSLNWDNVAFNDGGKSYYYVKVPTILVTDTDYIYVYWGNSTTIENKMGVWSK